MTRLLPYLQPAPQDPVRTGSQEDPNRGSAHPGLSWQRAMEQAQREGLASWFDAVPEAPPGGPALATPGSFLNGTGTWGLTRALDTLVTDGPKGEAEAAPTHTPSPAPLSPPTHADKLAAPSDPPPACASAPLPQPPAPAPPSAEPEVQPTAGAGPAPRLAQALASPVSEAVPVAVLAVDSPQATLVPWLPAPMSAPLPPEGAEGVPPVGTLPTQEAPVLTWTALPSGMPATPETEALAEEGPVRAAGLPAEATAPEPVRFHAEWSPAGVRVWLGYDADQTLPLAQITLHLQQWLAQGGERLIALVCNGKPVWHDNIEDSSSRPVTAAPSMTLTHPPALASRRFQCPSAQ